MRYYQKLHERYNHRDTIDQISLKDIDECNKWLVGELDDANVVGNYLFINEDSLDWNIVYKTSGVGEPLD